MHLRTRLAGLGHRGQPHQKAKDYTITVFFTTGQATVETYGTTARTVPAGMTTTWTATVRLATDPSTVCVLRGVG